MRQFGLVLALLAVHAPAPGQYHVRRDGLRKALPDSVIVLFGRGESGDLRSGFYQEPNFYYLTGWMQPGAILLLSPDSETLLLPGHDPEVEKFTGRRLTADDAEAPRITGFDSVRPVQAFESELGRLLEKYPKLYAIKGDTQLAKLQALAPMRTISDAELPIARMRMKKSPEELALIEKAIQASVDAHRAAFKRAAPGQYEYQVSATMVSTWMNEGCARPAYAPIVGSGPNSTILHYSANTRRMDAGEVLLIDAAAECNAYTADITRTFPIGGKFTARQRQVYDAVLGAQKAVIAAVKPGMALGKNQPNSLHKIAFDYLEARGLAKYFNHGIGHHVGLEVHDSFDPAQPLEAGDVITVEPGVYIPEENLGVRIEDMLLVTKNGAKLLTGALPREAAEIEKAVAR